MKLNRTQTTSSSIPLANSKTKSNDNDSFQMILNPRNAKRVFIKSSQSIKAQKLVLEQFLASLNYIKPDLNSNDLLKLEKIQGIINSILGFTFCEIINKYSIITEQIRNVLLMDIPEILDRFCSKILISILALVRFCTIFPFHNRERIGVNDDPKKEMVSSFSLSTIPEEGSFVVCPICSSQVIPSMSERHSKICILTYEKTKDMKYTCELIKELIINIEKEFLSVPWISIDDNSDILFYLYIVSLLKESLKDSVNIDDQVLGLPIICDYLLLIQSLASSVSVKNIAMDALSLIQIITELDNLIYNAGIEVRQTCLDNAEILSLKDFGFIKRISSGAFARVFLASNKNSNEFVAVKVIRKRDLTHKNSLNRILIEQGIMGSMKNPFMVQFKYSAIGYENFYLVMEYIPGGDIASMLDNFGSIDEEHVRIYISQIVIALKFLREHNIIHRDLKPKNILIDKEGKIKLIDFGLSHIGFSDRQINVQVEEQTALGSPHYIAPEIILMKPHSYTVDYWSLGILMYEFLYGMPPFNGHNYEEIFAKILKGNVVFPDNDCVSNECKELIKSLLTHDPEQRIGNNSIYEIINHQWFEKVGWDNLMSAEAPFIPKLVDYADTSYFNETNTPFRNESDDDIKNDIERGTTFVEFPETDNGITNEEKIKKLLIPGKKKDNLSQSNNSPKKNILSRFNSEADLVKK